MFVPGNKAPKTIARPLAQPPFIGLGLSNPPISSARPQSVAGKMLPARPAGWPSVVITSPVSMTCLKRRRSVLMDCRRVLAEPCRDRRTERADRRGILHLDGHHGAVSGRRFEADDTAVIDVRAFDGSPGNHLIWTIFGNVRIPLHSRARPAPRQPNANADLP